MAKTENLFLVIADDRDADPRVLRLDRQSIRVGRGEECEVRLREPALAEVQVVLRKRGRDWHLQPVGPPGRVWIRNQPVERPRPLPVDLAFRVGGHVLTLKRDPGPALENLPYDPREEADAAPPPGSFENPIEISPETDPVAAPSAPEPRSESRPEPRTLPRSQPLPHPIPETASAPSTAPPAPRPARDPRSWAATRPAVEPAPASHHPRLASNAWARVAPRARPVERAPMPPAWRERWSAKSRELQDRAAAIAPAPVPHPSPSPSPSPVPPLVAPAPNRVEPALRAPAPNIHWEPSPINVRTDVRGIFGHPVDVPLARRDRTAETFQPPIPPERPVAPAVPVASISVPLGPIEPPRLVAFPTAPRIKVEPPLPTIPVAPPAPPRHPDRVESPDSPARPATTGIAAEEPRIAQPADSDPSIPVSPAPELENETEPNASDQLPEPAVTVAAPADSIPEPISQPEAIDDARSITSAPADSIPNHPETEADPIPVEPEPSPEPELEPVCESPAAGIHPSPEPAPRSESELEPEPEPTRIPTETSELEPEPEPVPVASTPEPPRPTATPARALPSADDLPSARDVLNACGWAPRRDTARRSDRKFPRTDRAEPDPRPARKSKSKPKTTRLLQPTEARAPGGVSIPAFPIVWTAGLVLLLALIAAVGETTLEWVIDGHNFARLSNVALDPAVTNPVAKLGSTLQEIDAVPATSWRGGRPDHLYLHAHAVALARPWTDPADARSAETHLEAARRVAPLRPESRLAVAGGPDAESQQRRMGDLALLGQAREVPALTWLARECLKRGDRDNAARAYAGALALAVRAEVSDQNIPPFDDSAAVQRFELPREAVYRDLIREMDAAGAWKPAEWMEWLPNHGALWLAAAKVLRAKGSLAADDADRALQTLIGLDLDAPPDDAAPALHAAAIAEGRALARDWNAAESAYRRAIELARPGAPITRSWWFNLAEILSRTDRVDDREAALVVARDGPMLRPLTERLVRRSAASNRRPATVSNSGANANSNRPRDDASNAPAPPPTPIQTSPPRDVDEETRPVAELRPALDFQPGVPEDALIAPSGPELGPAPAPNSNPLAREADPSVKRIGVEENDQP